MTKQLSNTLGLNLLSDDISTKFFSTEIKNKDFESTLNRFHRKRNQCNLIIQEIIELTNQFRALEQNFWSTREDNSEREFNVEEARLFHQSQDLSFKINFLTEDYFIHTQMLMDRLCQLISFFIPDLQNSSKNFVSQMHYIIKNDCSNKNYTNYIKTKSNWFSLLVNIHRNNLIVHDNLTAISGTAWSKNNVLLCLFYHF